eukprot:TRINITY_DN864_c0_g2_i1.p1 TRINITY_DN864_c0_g2~~TRINITY_DN864_c0_g2_i1.p1  ORF type:complete len:258 (-),score=26.37 TRINITY_DN864_c0_g2_i1:50-823(-)
MVLGLSGSILAIVWLMAIVRKVRPRTQDRWNTIESVAVAAQQLSRQEDWWLFILTTCLASFIVAVIFGQWNFFNHTAHYYNLQNLSAYTAVNPATTLGQEIMDAGQVTFAPGTSIDVKKSMGFRNEETYCVAPIAGSGSLETYDFWAVGINCCSSKMSDFNCGGSANRSAIIGGLRVLNDDDRPFYRLAVQQAQSSFNIRATHPLFFYWTTDPVDQHNRYHRDATKYFLLGMYADFAVQIVLVVVAAAVLSDGSITV